MTCRGAVADRLANAGALGTTIWGVHHLGVAGGVSVGVTRIGTRLRRAKRESERGVVSVIAAFVLIAMVGMLALSVDASYAFGQRRLAQNVADSAALAGTRVIAEKLMNKPRTDADVLNAIRDVARNSSGGFVLPTISGAYDPTKEMYSAVYVADANSDGVPEDIVPEVKVGSGTIPATAKGLRVTPKRQELAMFSSVLGQAGLTATARAAALTLDAIGFGDWAPYAIWAGEEEHRCFNSAYDKTSGYEVRNDQYVGSTAYQYKYGCIPLWGGTRATPQGGPAANSDKMPDGGGLVTGPGKANINTNCWVPSLTAALSDCKRTRVVYYSPNYQQSNVYNGKDPDDPNTVPNPNDVVGGVTRWNQVSAAFKGFFHTNNKYIDISQPSGAVIDVDSTGLALGSGDMDKLHNCWAANQSVPYDQPVCLMVMPVVRYKTGIGGVSLTVVGFHSVRLWNDPYSNDNDWTADLVQTVMINRDVRVGPCPPENGIPCIKVVRLVE